MRASGSSHAGIFISSCSSNSKAGIVAEGEGITAGGSTCKGSSSVDNSGKTGVASLGSGLSSSRTAFSWTSSVFSVAIDCSVSGKDGVSTSGVAGFSAAGFTSSFSASAFTVELDAASANCIVASSSCKRAVCCFNSSVSGSLAAGTFGGAAGTSAAAGFTSKKGARLDKSTFARFAGASTGAKKEARLSDGRSEAKLRVGVGLDSGSAGFAVGA